MFIDDDIEATDSDCSAPVTNPQQVDQQNGTNEDIPIVDESSIVLWGIVTSDYHAYSFTGMLIVNYNTCLSRMEDVT